MNVEITEKKLKEFEVCMERNKLMPGPLMPTLQDAQRIFECVPQAVQAIISRELNESLAKISGIISFYTMFSDEPRGKYVISVCTGTACYVKGAKKILDKVCEILDTPFGETSKDGMFTIAPTRCVGACGLAPVVMVNEDVHGKLTVSDIPSLIKQYTDRILD